MLKNYALQKQALFEDKSNLEEKNKFVNIYNFKNQIHFNSN